MFLDPGPDVTLWRMRRHQNEGSEEWFTISSFVAEFYCAAMTLPLILVAVAHRSQFLSIYALTFCWHHVLVSELLKRITDILPLLLFYWILSGHAQLRVTTLTYFDSLVSLFLYFMDCYVSNHPSYTIRSFTRTSFYFSLSLFLNASLPKI